MTDFDFDKFEKNIPKFVLQLKTQIQTRCFNPIAPDFDVEVSVFDKGRGYGKGIAIETTDIAEHMNFKMFGKVWLHNFGGSVLKEVPDSFWLPINWRWESKGGGSNGTDAFTCYVNDAGNITAIRD